MTFISPQRLAPLLGDYAHRVDVDAIAQCDSTNLECQRRLAAGAASGLLVISDQQTAGRGRRGRQWHSQVGRSLTFSLLWRLPKGRSVEGLSLAVGLALCQALQSPQCGAFPVRLKWPNDLLLCLHLAVESSSAPAITTSTTQATSTTQQYGKLAGILIDLLTEGGQLWSVIGIGINYLTPESFVLDAGALPALGLDAALGLDSALWLDTTLAKQSSNTDEQNDAAIIANNIGLPEAHFLLANLLISLIKTLDEFNEHGFAPMRLAWQQQHYFQHQAVEIAQEHQPRQHGICQGVNEHGHLLLATEDGITAITVGDVSLRSSNSNSNSSNNKQH